MSSQGHRRVRIVAIIAAPVAVIAMAALAWAGISSSQPTATAAAPMDVRTNTRVIGTSVQGRQITATGYGDAAARRVIVAIGVIHGSETAGLGIVDRLAATGAPAGTRLWIVRDVNPDGTARGTRQNARGVDLNRNTPDKWKRGPRGTYYPGKRAASEPETRAYLDFLSNTRPDLVLIFHQHANGVDSYGLKDSALIASLSQALALPVKSFNCAGICRGTLTGWFNGRFPGSAVTIELPARVTPARASQFAAGVTQIAATVRDVD